MVYKLYIGIPTYTDINLTFPKPEDDNYNYWIPLVNLFIDKADQIEINCWNKEIETIEEIKSLHKETLEMIIEGDLTVFKGNITAAIRDYLLHSNINKNKELKWFTVIFKKNQVALFRSEHWGTEFFATAVSEKEIKYLENITPSKTTFHQYQ